MNCPHASCLPETVEFKKALPDMKIKWQPFRQELPSSRLPQREFTLPEPA
jgi:hypothetical protein